jgi:hypothetical protein
VNVIREQEAQNCALQKKIFLNKTKSKNMSRTFAMTMARPHERLGLPQPLGRRIPAGVVGWNVLIAIVMLGLIVGYVVQVNRAAARGFKLRDMEKRVEALTTEVTSFDDRVSQLSSIQALSERATMLGFVPIDRLEFVRPGGTSYAFAH